MLLHLIMILAFGSVTIAFVLCRNPSDIFPTAGCCMPRRQRIVPFEKVSAHFDVPINDAAKELGICVTLLKRICRQNGIYNFFANFFGPITYGC